MNPQPLSLSSVPPHSLTNDVKSIQVTALITEVIDAEKRRFSEKFVAKLAQSIEADGLLSPVIVEDLQNGRYKVLAGRHRVHACAEILKWQEIPCLVLNEPDEDLVEVVDLASNLLNHPLDPPQRARALQRWLEIHKKRYPSVSRTGRSPNGKGFAKTLETSLGISPGHAERLATTAEHIKPDARKALEEVGVSETQIDQFAAIRDQKAIATAVNLASDGVDPKEAIRVGKAEKKPKGKPAAAPVEGSPAPGAPKVVRSSDLTDDEWLETHCSKMMAILPFKNAYKRDAILYRRLAEKTIAYRTSAKKALAEAKKPAENGLFFSFVFKLTRAAHPMHWLICDGCNGTGHKPEDKSVACGKCMGGGYKVKFEEV
jgi:ParB/RepB/Spo0J family partition protein